MSTEKIVDQLANQLPGIRWWPWKGVYKKISVIYMKYVDNTFFFIIGTENNTRFYLPLTRKTEGINLPEERILKLDSEVYVEAEYTSNYLSLLDKNSDVIREDYLPIIGKVKNAKPLTLESTNVVALHELENGEKLVVKSYRLLPRVNMEPLMLSWLQRNDFRNIPRVYRIYKLKDEPVTIVLEHVDGIGDGGYPFYIAYKEALTRQKRCRRLGREGYRLGLASKLGVIIADMHKKLNPTVPTDFFGLEEITDKDVSRWNRRIEKRYNEILRLLDEIVSRKTRKIDTNRYEFWREILDTRARPIIENALIGMERFVDAFKGRIHQDLHLLQMIYVPGEKGRGEDFYIIDFEGEPGRSEDERIEKEPLIRDIATMIRSFQYLSFMAYLEVRGGTIDQVAKRLLRSDSTCQWRMEHSLAMTLAYLAETMAGSRDLHGVKYKRKGHSGYEITQINIYNELLMPWLVERALYEIYYEACYRPEWIPVPIIGLLNPSIPAPFINREDNTQ